MRLQKQKKLTLSAWSNQGQPSYGLYRHVGIDQVEATQAPGGFVETAVEFQLI